MEFTTGIHSGILEVSLLDSHKN